MSLFIVGCLFAVLSVAVVARYLLSQVVVVVFGVFVAIVGAG